MHLIFINFFFVKIELITVDHTGTYLECVEYEFYGYHVMNSLRRRAELWVFFPLIFVGCACVFRLTQYFWLSCLVMSFSF